MNDKPMDSGSLTQLYDRLKQNRDQLLTGQDLGTLSMDDDQPQVLMPVAQPPIADQWRAKAAKCRDELRDHCAKHLIVDIYCKILPLDADYICRNGQQCQHDVDQMLSAKGMTPVQYLKSCSDTTNAPLLEYMLHSIDRIAQLYYEDAEKVLDKAIQDGENIPAPETPGDDDDSVKDELVAIKKDDSYESFIDTLKKKTIDKIVNDVSQIINDKKDESSMEFQLNQSSEGSPLGEAMDYLNHHLWEEYQEMSSSLLDEMIGLSIREATMYQMDQCFNQPMSTFQEFASRMYYGKGYLINESGLNEIRTKLSHLA